jgi:hypothetical protein
MAYVAVPTKSTGDLWTAADNNTYIRDNFAAGVPDIFTTKGDIAVATAADAASRLGVGADGQVLTAASGEATGILWAADTLATVVDAKGDLIVGSGADAVARLAVGADGSILLADSAATNGVKWSGAFPQARYTVVAGELTCANTAHTILNFDTSVYDTATAVTTGAAWKFTVPTGQGGYYLVCSAVLLKATTNWAVNEAAYLELYKGGVIQAYLAGSAQQASSSGGAYNIFLSGSAIISLAATNYIDIRLWHNSGTDETVDDDATACWVAISRIM